MKNILDKFWIYAVLENKPLFFFKSLSGLNFADIAQRQGLYPSPRKPPFIPGFECSGTVEELGEGVTGLEVSSPLHNISWWIVLVLSLIQDVCFFCFICNTIIILLYGKVNSSILIGSFLVGILPYRQNTQKLPLSHSPEISLPRYLLCFGPVHILGCRGKIFIEENINRGYYMVSQRYEFYFWVSKNNVNSKQAQRGSNRLTVCTNNHEKVRNNFIEDIYTQVPDLVLHNVWVLQLVYFR